MGKTVDTITLEHAQAIIVEFPELRISSRNLATVAKHIAAAIREDRAEPVSEAEVERFGQEMASIVDEEWPPKRDPEEARKYARMICEAARKARTE